VSVCARRLAGWGWLHEFMWTPNAELLRPWPFDRPVGPVGVDSLTDHIHIQIYDIIPIVHILGVGPLGIGGPGETAPLARP
jgi:hypothetical protein